MVVRLLTRLNWRVLKAGGLNFIPINKGKLSFKHLFTTFASKMIFHHFFFTSCELVQSQEFPSFLTRFLGLPRLDSFICKAIRFQGFLSFLISFLSLSCLGSLISHGFVHRYSHTFSEVISWPRKDKTVSNKFQLLGRRTLFSSPAFASGRISSRP